MKFPNPMKCPKCEQQIENVYYEVVEAVDPASLKIGFTAIVFSCPNEYCRTVLSVETQD